MVPKSPSDSSLSIHLLPVSSLDPPTLTMHTWPALSWSQRIWNLETYWKTACEPESPEQVNSQSGLGNLTYRIRYLSIPSLRWSTKLSKGFLPSCPQSKENEWRNHPCPFQDIHCSAHPEQAYHIALTVEPWEETICVPSRTYTALPFQNGWIV